MALQGGKYNFKEDITFGEKGQLIIREFLEDKNFKFIGECFDYRYDLKMSYQNKEYTYEIKTDIYPRDTGNIVIEFESRGKPSGISVTEADYFVTYFYHFGEIWNIKTSNLKKILKELKPQIKENCGDPGSNTKVYVLKKKDYRKFFTIHSIDLKKKL
jgi:hypothetical protein